MSFDIAVKIDADPGDLEQVLRGIESRMMGMGKEADTAAGQTATLTGRLDKLDSSVTGMATAMERAAGETNALLRAIRDQATEAGNADRKTAAYVSSLAELGKVGAYLYAIKSFADGIINLGKAMADAQVKSDSLETGLKFAINAPVPKSMQYLRDMTKDLGMEFDTTARAYVKFNAAARETSLEGDGARKVFEAVGKASTVMGLSADETSGIMLSLSQMISKGTVQSEELKGQLGERLPGAFQIAARAMGVTTGELGKMLEKGEVIADEFLPRFAEQLEKELGNASEEASQKLQASLNRAGNAWGDLKKAIADSGVADAMKSMADASASAMDATARGFRDAKADGGGFFSQVASGVMEFSNQVVGVRAFGVSFGDTGKMMKEAQDKMMALQEQSKVQTGNPYIAQSILDLRAYIGQIGLAMTAEAQRRAAVNGQNNESLAETNRLMQASNAAGAAAAARTKLEADLGTQVQKLSGISKDYVPQIQLAKQGYEAGALTAAEYADRVTKITAASVKDTEEQKLAKKARDDATSAAKKAVDEHDRLIKSYVDVADKAKRKSDTDLIEADSQVKLTDTQKKYIEVFADIRDGKVKYTDLVKAGVIEDLNAALANDKLAAAVKAAATATRDAEKASADAVKANQTFTNSIEKKNLTLDEEIYKQQAANDKLAGNKTALIENTVEKYLALAAASERAAMVALERNEDEAQYETLKRQAAKYRELAGLKENAIYLTEAKEARDAWDKTTKSIGDGLTNSLFRAFESGKDFFKTLWDGVINTFKTTILKPVIEDTVKDFVGWFKSAATNISSTVLKPGLSTDGMGSFFDTLRGGFSTLLSNVAGGFSSLLTGAGNLFRSLFSGGSSAGGAAGGGAGGLGSLISTGSSMINGISSMGSTVMGWLGMGSGAAASTASYSAMVAASEAAAYGVGTGAAGAAAGAGGLMSSLAAAAPWIAAGLLVVSLLSKKKGGPKVEGGYTSAGFTGIPVTAGGELAGGAQGIFEGVQTAYGGLATSLGGTAGALTGATFISKDPKGTAKTQFVLDAALNGTEVYSRNNRSTGGNVEDVGRSEDELGNAVDLASTQALLKALQATDFADEIDTKLDAISTSGSAAQIKAAIAAVVDYKAQQDAANAPATSATVDASGGSGSYNLGGTISTEVMGTYTRIAEATELTFNAVANLRDWLYDSSANAANFTRQALYDIDANEAISRDLVTGHLSNLQGWLYDSAASGAQLNRQAIYDAAANDTETRNRVVEELRLLRTEVATLREAVTTQVVPAVNETAAQVRRGADTAELARVEIAGAVKDSGRLVADTIREAA